MPRKIVAVVYPLSDTNHLQILSLTPSHHHHFHHCPMLVKYLVVPHFFTMIITDRYWHVFHSRRFWMNHNSWVTAYGGAALSTFNRARCWAAIRHHVCDLQGQWNRRDLSIHGNCLVTTDNLSTYFPHAGVWSPRDQRYHTNSRRYKPAVYVASGTAD